MFKLCARKFRLLANMCQPNSKIINHFPKVTARNFVFSLFWKPWKFSYDHITNLGSNCHFYLFYGFSFMNPFHVIGLIASKIFLLLWFIKKIRKFSNICTYFKIINAKIITCQIFLQNYRHFSDFFVFGKIANA